MGQPLPTETPNRLISRTLSGDLDSFERSELDDAALESDHGGVGSVLGAQFGEDVPDLALHRVLAGRELRGDLFVRIPLGNEAQDTDFRGGQPIASGMFAQPQVTVGGPGS